MSKWKSLEQFTHILVLLGRNVFPCPLSHLEVRCELLWPINMSSTSVTSKWKFRNQCIMCSSSACYDGVWSQWDKSFHLHDVSVSMLYVNQMYLFSCPSFIFHKVNNWLFICLVFFVPVTNYSRTRSYNIESSSMIFFRSSNEQVSYYSHINTEDLTPWALFFFPFLIWVGWLLGLLHHWYPVTSLHLYPRDSFHSSPD